MSFYKAAVIGSTGQTGLETVNQLLLSPKCGEVIALVRKGRTVPHLPSDPALLGKLKQVEVDFDALETTATSALEGTDVVFCCLGTTIKAAGSKEQFRKVDFEYVKGSAELAKKLGVKQFSLVTAGHSSPDSWFLYPRTKGEAEESVKAQGFPSVSIFRPSLLITKEREDQRFGEKIAQKVWPSLNWMFAGPLKNMKSISTETVARAMVRDFESKWSSSSLSGVNVFESFQIEETGKM